MCSGSRPVKSTLGDALPTEIYPTHYILALDIDWGASPSFSGRVVCTLTCVAACDSIKLNVKGLPITSVVLDGQAVREFSLDEEMERLVVPVAVAVGQHTLEVEWSTTPVTDSLCGFYSSTSGDWMCLLTQFEAVDARRAVPCWDEPSFKATWDVRISAKRGLVVLANMPERERAPDAKDAGKEVVMFETTPPMSSYLLAWAVAPELACVEGKSARGTRVRCFARPGLEKQLDFALQVSVKALDFYDAYFDIPYALPHLSMIAVPDFAMGAMENWGLVTYRERYMLCDESTPGDLKIDVAYTIAHELAHQWFGNLASPQSFVELWLNEGTATYFGWEATDALFPEWGVWDLFAVEEHEQALSLDSLRSSHPIIVPIAKAREIDDVFDAISYCKGCAVIVQLVTFVGGKEVFQRGIRKFLLAHSFACAESDALWEAMAEVSGKNVKAFMHGWTSVDGFPLVSVSPAGEVSQKRFIRGSTEGAHDHLWVVPLGASSTGASALPELLEARTMALPVSSAEGLVINTGLGSFFRTHYQDLTPVKAMIAGGTFPVSNQAGLVSDLNALASAGTISTPEALAFALDAFTGRTNAYVVWRQLQRFLVEVRSVFPSATASAPLSAKVLALLSPLAKALGFANIPGEPHQDVLLRGIIIPEVAAWGCPATLAEARARLTQGTMPVDLMSGLYRVLALKDREGAVHQALRDRFTATNPEASDDEKICVLRSLCAGAVSAEAVEEQLAWCLANARNQDVYVVFGGAAANPLPGTAWGLLKARFEPLRARLAASPSLLASCASSVISAMTDHALITEAEAFMAQAKIEGAAMTIAQAIETARIRADQRARDERKMNECF
jgi:aminopeptidase 2